MYNFFMFFFCYKEKNNLSLSIFCQKLPFLPQNAWFFFLKSKNGVLEIFLKSNILCTKILGTVKFFLKSKNFLKSNVLKSKIHCTHSSLLSVFGLNATSTYDSYLPLIFGKFALIWGHFQNILTSRFRGRWGRRGQTTSKSKTTKILNENLLKLDEIQILASATSKMTSWPQRPRKGLSGFFQKIHF